MTGPASRRLAGAFALWVLGASSVAGQASPYADATAAALHEAAMANRELRDDQVLQYTAVVRQRIAAALRTPLKDRTLYRAESAHRVFWNRDGGMLVQALAARQQSPVGVVDADESLGLFDQSFDPMNDRLFFGLMERDEDLGDPAEDDFWFEHPLYPEYRDAYRFTSGDTLTLGLPDGRRVRVIELQVVPLVASVHRMTGSLWIEPESGALVRAVYRLADTFDAVRDIEELREEDARGSFRFVPGLFKPWTAEIQLMAVEYGLWDFGIWLPRMFRAEGVVGAGILKAPGTFELSYDIESVTTESDLAEAAAATATADATGATAAEEDGVEHIHFRARSEAMAYLGQRVFGGRVPYVVHPEEGRSDGRRVTYLVPQDLDFLTTSPALPPPVWDDAPGFPSDADVDEYFASLAALPVAPLPQTPATFRWGFQRPDLVRYNRVEALSVGARGQLRPSTPVGPLSVTAIARIGVADLHPNASLEIAHETIADRIALVGFHELTTIDEGARHFGIGNSLLAAAFGRDDGDYYRRTGGMLEWTPPVAGRRTYRIRGYAEYHEAVEAETSFTLLHATSDTWSFRPNIAADEGWEYGASLELTPYWGSDPNLAQGGLDLLVQAGTGDFEYARSALGAHVVLPLPARLRIALQAAAGTSWGAPSTQRLWYLGGPSTLRGYDPRAAGGESFLRARGELARGTSFGRLSLFSDVGWAGDRSSARWDDALRSVGVGVSLLDGLIRFDGAWALDEPDGFRFDAYLDQIL
ncbi:MAG: hypothetical protein AB7T31_15370 [Gemmatimonadales bacterium]